jgi:NADH-quinone oxidoreductase subunit E
MNPEITIKAEGTFNPPLEWETEIDALVERYPQKRSAAVMVLHSLQDRFGFISASGIEWVAKKLEVEPIHILELVTFYPMFRQKPVGKYHIKVCRTISCALSGSGKLHEYLLKKLGLHPNGHGILTTQDGRYSLEFVECLASCGTGPVMMINDRLYEKVSSENVDAILGMLP